MSWSPFLKRLVPSMQQVARLVAQLAQVRAPDGAVPAAPTRRDVRRQDVIADLDAADVRADRLDDAGTLVAEHHRRRMGHDALDVVEIAVADAARGVADPDLVSARLLQVEHLDLDALTGLVVDRRLDLHGHTILVRSLWIRRAAWRSRIPACMSSSGTAR